MMPIMQFEQALGEKLDSALIVDIHKHCGANPSIGQIREFIFLQWAKELNHHYKMRSEDSAVMD